MDAETYWMVGGDQREYGPAAPDEMRQWIREGRANGDTLVRSSDDERWRPLREYPELYSEQGPAPPPPVPILPTGTPPHFGPINAEHAMWAGWQLFRNNVLILMGAAAVFLALNAVLYGLGTQRQYVILVFIISMVVGGPLLGGLAFLYLRVLRGLPATLEDLFAGFRLAFVQLVLGNAVVNLAVSLAASPFLLATTTGMALLKTNPQLALPLVAVGSAGAITAFLLLSWIWLFTTPLIIDGHLDFWRAMETSRKAVMQAPWQTFLLVLAVVVFNLMGALACGVGVLFTLPITIAAVMHAYEALFRAAPR